MKKSSPSSFFQISPDDILFAIHSIILIHIYMYIYIYIRVKQIFNEIFRAKLLRQNKGSKNGIRLRNIFWVVVFFHSSSSSS
jgi:hypothetical protein